jgi:hypothetical protein
MLTFKTFLKFLKLLDQAATGIDSNRKSLCTIHELEVIPNDEGSITRLAVTNGHILVICDIDTVLLDWASQSKPIVLDRRSDKGQRCYLVPEKRNLEDKDIFPYPDLMCCIPKNLHAVDKNIPVYFKTYYITLACKIFDAYSDNKPGYSTYFLVTHDCDSPIGLKVSMRDGIMIGIMPLRSQHDINKTEKISPVNSYLPGFFKDKLILTCPNCGQIIDCYNEAATVECPWCKNIVIL